MINFHDLGVNFASKAHNERIKHAQMLYKFTPNTLQIDPQGVHVPLLKFYSEDCS